MSQIFVWQSRGMPPSEAHDRFVQRLTEQTRFYNGILNTECTFRFARCGDVLVGQISSDLGLSGWQPWHEQAGLGIAWAGVCEELLGWRGDDAQVSTWVADVISRPERLGDLSGSFSVCAWDQTAGSVAVATGATKHQTLWEASGPTGFAVGSRARPVLDLVGRDPELDADEASVFIAYKHLLGTGCLYRHVNRVSSRLQILFKDARAPQMRTYQTLAEYLGEAESLSFSEAINRCAGVLKSHVARQADASTRPVLHLTGGRDSRCIAAALYDAGFRGPASTGGSPSSSDVILAEKVANTLGMSHVRTGGVTRIELLSRLAAHRDRGRIYAHLSEGVATIKHGLWHRELFESADLYPSEVVPAFNGHHAGLQKREIGTFVPAHLNRFLGTHFRRYDAVLERFEAMRQSLNSELNALGAAVDRWPEMYYWQQDALQWGQDNMLVGDLFEWNWTPLFDKTLIRTGWHLPKQHRASMAFVEGITLEIAPGLSGVPYGKLTGQKPLHTRLMSVWLRKSRPLRARFSAPSLSRELEAERQLWKNVLLDSDHTHWKELIDPAYVMQSIESERPNDIPWNVATVQLFIESNF